jgi:hypothetical protein
MGGSPAPVSSEEENRKQPGPKGRIRSRKEGENGGYPAGRQMDVEEKKVLKGRPDVRFGGKPRNVLLKGKDEARGDGKRGFSGWP